MTKRDLAKRVASRFACTIFQAEDQIDFFLKEIKKTLKKGETVTFRTFGTFKTVVRKARKARSFQQGKVIDMPARNKVVFLASDALTNPKGFKNP